VIRVDACIKPDSKLWFTSMRANRNPAAMRGSQFSSRWKRIVRGHFVEPYAEDLKRNFCHFVTSSSSRQIGVELKTMGYVIRQGRIRRRVRVKEDKWRRLSRPNPPRDSCPDGNVMEPDSMYGNVRFAPQSRGV